MANATPLLVLVLVGASFLVVATTLSAAQGPDEGFSFVLLLALLSVPTFVFLNAVRDWLRPSEPPGPRRP